MTAGLGTRLLKLEIDGDQVEAEVSKAVITSNDAGSDFTTFADAAAGGAREYRLEFTAVQDPVNSASIWRKVFDQAGDDVDFILDPVGGGTAGAGNPLYSGTVTITEPDGDFLGGSADKSTSARFTFDCAWVLTGKPVEDITP